MKDKILQITDNSSNERVYYVPVKQKIRWRYWEGDYVVFSSISGETYTLDIASGRVLERIIDQPTMLEDIRATIASFLEVENDTELANAVNQILLHLEDAGLIESES